MSVAQNYTGKPTRPLKYLDEREQDDGTVRDLILPEHAQTVRREDTTPPTIEQLELGWRHRHTAAMKQADLRALLQSRLTGYQLSPTHLGTFLDLEYGGPEHFFFNSILRFPEAPSPDSEFGNAIHETLEWVQHRTAERGSTPPVSEAIDHFIIRMQRKKLTPARILLETERGQAALAAYLTARGSTFKPADRAELAFKHEQVHLGDVYLSGKVDRLEIDAGAKTITVVDYKTGKSFARWASEPKLHRYRRQLYCYKLLVEGSASFGGYHVRSGRLEFVEPDPQGRINSLELTYTDEELERTKQLLAAMWRHVQALSFPDVSAYQSNLSGIRQFEQDLIDGTI
jgi:hypothetical protein